MLRGVDVMWFFPLGIVDTRVNGTGLDVVLSCGCVLYYVASSRRAMAPCWEHQAQFVFAQSIVTTAPALRN